MTFISQRDMHRQALENIANHRIKAQNEWNWKRKLTLEENPKLKRMIDQRSMLFFSVLYAKSDEPEVSLLNLKKYFEEKNREFPEFLKSQFETSREISNRILEEAHNITTDIKKYISENRIDFPEEPKYLCKKCKDTGCSDNRLCECVKVEKSRLLSEQFVREYGGEIKTFSQIRYDIMSIQSAAALDIAARKCYEFAQSTVCNKKKQYGILLSGPPGVGKTHLSFSIASYCINNNIFVIYGTAKNLLNILYRATYDTAKYGESYDIIRNSQLLVLDDLGAENDKNGDFAAEFFELINHRYNNSLPTVISTNFDTQKFRMHYGDRVFSRLKLYTQLSLNIGDYRDIEAKIMKGEI